MLKKLNFNITTFSYPSLDLNFEYKSNLYFEFNMNNYESIILNLYDSYFYNFDFNKPFIIHLINKNKIFYYTTLYVNNNGEINICEVYKNYANIYYILKKYTFNNDFFKNNFILYISQECESFVDTQKCFSDMNNSLYELEKMKRDINWYKYLSDKSSI